MQPAAAETSAVKNVAVRVIRIGMKTLAETRSGEEVGDHDMVNVVKGGYEKEQCLLDQ